MAHLFEIVNNEVVPIPEVLLISPFKEIWNRDRSVQKKKAINELSYIEYMTSMKLSNPFRNYDSNIKSSKIIVELFPRDEWQPDERIKKGIEKIEEWQKEASVTYSYFLDVKEIAEKLRESIRNIDITELNPKTGVPLFKPKDISNALLDTDKVMNMLNNVEKKLNDDFNEEARVRGGREISPFADPESLR